MKPSNIIFILTLLTGSVRGTTIQHSVMKDKIKQNGGTVWFLMANDEGHGFRKKNNVDLQFYSTIAFIKQFLIN